MKQTLLFAFFFICANLHAQPRANNERAEYNIQNKKGRYMEYLSSTGDLIKVGDSLEIGVAANFDKFVYITQDVYPMHADHTGKKVKIRSIEVIGNKNSGLSVYFTFKGFGLIPVYVNYEAALKAGEIKLIGAKMTKAEAIEKLKKQKELLDLDLIKQEEYDKLREELSPIILE